MMVRLETLAQEKQYRVGGRFKLYKSCPITIYAAPWHLTQRQSEAGATNPPGPGLAARDEPRTMTLGYRPRDWGGGPPHRPLPSARGKDLSSR